MRRLWAAGAAIVMSLVLSGMPVGAQEPSGEASGPSAGPITIGFTNFFTGGDFFDKIALGIREAADAAGAELIEEDAQGDPAVQSEQIEGFIAEGVDAIIVAPSDPDGIVEAVEAANAAGVPVLAVDRTVNGGIITSFIASDNTAGGRMAGEALIAAMGGSGAVIEVQGDFASASAGRGEGFAQALAAAPKVTLAGQEAAYGDPGMAASITADLLGQHREVTGVFAQNDDMAFGVVEALAVLGLGDQVKVVGFDAAPVVLPLVKDGSMAATIAQQPLLMGQKAVEAAISAATGEPVEAFIPIETTLVTADNIDQFLTEEMTAGPTVGKWEPDDPMAPSGATIQITDVPFFAYGEPQPDDSGVLHELGRKLTMTWESSDPRLSGEVTYDGNRDMYSGNLDFGVTVGTETFEIVNDGGRWIGQGTGWSIPSQSAGDVVLLQGQGGYEGLSALVHIDWSDWSIGAIIFPGEMPSPVEPAPSE
jgi:ABC-type sugar transport system substrate-binding protein